MTLTPRRGASLAAKLIVGMIALLAAAVGAGAYYSHRALDDLAQRGVAERRSDGEGAMRRQAQLTVKNLAISTASPLAEGNFTYLAELVAAAQKEDAHVVWLTIRDAHSGKDVVTAGQPGEAADVTTYSSDIQVNGEVVGSLQLGYSAAELEAALDSSLTEARAHATGSARKQLLFASIVLLAGILLGSIQAYRMTRQLELLTAQTGLIAAGQFTQRVHVRSRDEIGQLAASFNTMAESLDHLIVQVMDKASMEKELEVARNMQDLMTPPRTLHRVGPVSISGRCDMATQCGGDWWWYRELGSGKILLVVGDVTGHGMPAAMVAATARGALEALRGVDDAALSPTRVLDALDDAVRGTGQLNLLMTCFAILIDPASQSIDFANAGHCFPYLLSRNADGTLSDLGVLAVRGNPLGSPTRSFNVWRKPFVVGSVLVMATDGLTDRVNLAGDRFGDRRYRALLSTGALADDPAAVADLRDSIVSEVERFSAGAPPDDDVTIVMCHFHGQREQVPGLREVA